MISNIVPLMSSLCFKMINSRVVEEVSWFHLCLLAVVSQQSNANTNTDVYYRQNKSEANIFFLQLGEKKCISCVVVAFFDTV